MKKKFKVGDLVYTRNVGYPFNRTDDGGESWEGASCIVSKLNTGWNGTYIEVTPIFPVKTANGIMESCIFQPEQLVKETRPWLKKNLKRIINFRKEVTRTSEYLKQLLD